MAEVDEKSGGIIKSEDKNGNMKIEFCKGLMQSYIDTYYIVAESLYSIMEVQVIIEQKKLIVQLHEGIQSLHYKGVIKFMNSCLIEIFETAYGRFAELGLFNLQVFDSHDGNKIAYLSCPASKREILSKYINILQGMSTAGQNRENMKLMEKEIITAIEIAKGPMARL